MSNRYALYNTTTGEILKVISRSQPGWADDYPAPDGTRLGSIGDAALDDSTHYYVVGAGDPVLTERPVVGMGADATLTGDGSAQVVAMSLPAGTFVRRDFERLGTFSGTLTWAPSSPADNGRHRYDLEPPFPYKAETIWITVEAP